MLREQMWYNYSDALETALLQAEDEGKDTGRIRGEVEALHLSASFTYEEDQAVGRMLERMEALPVKADYPYDEPSDLLGIHALQTPEKIRKGALKKESLDGKIHGAWLGRVCGCILGKPVENWTHQAIRALAEAGKNYPMTDYIDRNAAVSSDMGYGSALEEGWFQDRLDGAAPADDDTSYTVLALKILETYGREFTSLDVAEAWLMNLSALNVCTAELAGYRNLLNHVLPPASASFRNPYKEWVGAQIRSDFYGYINPGDPLAAADMAYRDACMTHTRNGIYGAMMAAAMIAQAAVAEGPEEIVMAGLAVIPHTSRLYEEISSVLSWYRMGTGYWEAVERVFSKYPQQVMHHAVHTISNGMLVVIALLYGEGDFTKTIANVVMPGYDTDSNGATAGSVAGMLVGEEGIDPKWCERFQDTLCTNISGDQEVRISGLAERTMRVMKQVYQKNLTETVDET